MTITVAGRTFTVTSEAELLALLFALGAVAPAALTGYLVRRACTGATDARAWSG